MKHLIVAMFIGLQVFLLAELPAASLPDYPGASLEPAVQGHWLVAANAQDQQEGQADTANDDEEPDCD